MNTTANSQPVLVGGGDIGGLAAALALTRQGFAVKVLEQAGIQGIQVGIGIHLLFAAELRFISLTAAHGDGLGG